MPTILLVEDNEMNRDMLSRRLIKRGFDVVMAGDGEEALARVQHAPPALVLMDMSLPVLDGWEATRRLKADPATRAVPVIGLTAHAMAGDREKALAAGADDFDTKPVDFPRLLGKIEALLGAPAGGAPPAAACERPARLEHLAALVEHAVARCRSHGGSEGACADVRLAVEEVCVNIMSHGYGAGEAGPIRVAVTEHRRALVITIADEAPAFDPAAAPPPDLTSNWQDRREGGLGWHLVRSVMDEVRHAARQPRGNVVTLIKSLEE